MDTPNISELIRDAADEFLVSPRVYRDAELYQAELKRIFHSTWVYLGHESEVANRGDYKSTLIGQQPVILVRDQDDGLKAFMNFCTHRGALLAREEYGNARTFVCPYHAWSFRTSGELIGVTDSARYPASFTTAGKDLIPVPRLASYGGLVFGSLNADVMELGDYLGDVRAHIDRWLKRTAGSSYKVNLAHKYAFPGNWKFQSENVVDGYHPVIVHRSALSALRKFDLLGKRVLDENTGVRQGGCVRGFPNGHSTLEAGSARDLIFADPEAQRKYVEKLAALHGAENVTNVLSNQHILIFPNLAIMDMNIRVIQPVAMNRTEVYSYPVSIVDASDNINAARLQELQLRLGTAGMVQTDDIDIFGGNQTGMSVEAAQWLILSRGLEREEVTPSGVRIGEYSDEVPQRSFWRQWRAMMGGV